MPTAIAKVTGKASICKYTADFDDFDETYHTFVVAMGKQGTASQSTGTVSRSPSLRSMR